jgi:predicted transcriptional regulator
VPNIVIYDTSISAKAKGVFVYLISRPSEWAFFMSEIQEHFTDGASSIRTAVEELQEAGYIERIKRGIVGGGTYYEWSISPNAKIAYGTKCENRTVVSTEYNNIIYNSKDNSNNTISKPKKSTRFKKPTAQEVQDYCNTRDNGIDGQYFIDHYEANGWLRGKTPIKSWQACVRTWEGNNKKSGVNQTLHKEDNTNNLGVKEYTHLKRLVTEGTVSRADGDYMKRKGLLTGYALESF